MPSDVAGNQAQGRIRMLERHEVTPELGALYDALLQQRGVQGVVAFLKPIVGDGALPGWYKELIAVRICLLHKFEYGIRAHSLSAKQKGARDVQISALQDFETGPFSDAEKLGFRYADRLHNSPQIDDEFYAQLKAAYNDLQIMELTAVAAAFEFFPRFIGALRIPITPAPAAR